MILDYDDEFTTAGGQSIVGNAGTAIIGTKVKNGGAAGDWGSGDCIFPYVRCTTVVAGASSGVQIDIVTDTAAGLATSPTVLSTKTISASALTANSIHAMPPLYPGTRKQYLGVKITPTGSNTTTGALVVGLTSEAGRPQNGVNSL